jgi:UPF0755 protein
VTAISITLALVCAVVLRDGLRSLDQPARLASTLRYRIGPGTRIAHVAAELNSQGIISQPKAWVWYARFKGSASALKAGEYAIAPGTTPRQLLEKFVSGQVLLHSFTIIDGWRTQDLLAAMRRNPEIVTTLAAGHTMQVLGEPEAESEGQFLPETYRFPSGTTDLDLLRQAHTALSRELDSAWQSRDPEIPLRNPHELLIMASIVEKETGLPEELGKVAGLYLHRLRIGMLLQADPTIIYGLGDRYDGELRTVDLRTDGPYNSYTRVGLPPTAIALPSAAALRATARPEKTDALYFVASAKGDGTHVFSPTYEAHKAAVAQYWAHQRQKSATKE